jgi:hypothetical protein
VICVTAPAGNIVASRSAENRRVCVRIDVPLFGVAHDVREMRYIGCRCGAPRGQRHQSSAVPILFVRSFETLQKNHLGLTTELTGRYVLSAWLVRPQCMEFV